jgi:hypothetical protein
MKHTTRLLLAILTLTACADSTGPISDVSMLDAKESQVAGINSSSGSIQAAAAVGDEVIMWSGFDTPASGSKMRVVSATGASECPDTPFYKARILWPDPGAQSRSPSDEPYFDTPLVAGTELTVVGFFIQTLTCVGADFNGTRMIVTKVPQK